MPSIRSVASMIAGAVGVHLFSGGAWLLLGGAPSSRAAWSWECTVFPDSDSAKPIYLAPGKEGATCTDGHKLNCTCAVSPCDGLNAAKLSDLACAGAGDDKDKCMKLHQTYGTSPGALTAVAGRGSGKLTDACGSAEVIKVYGNKDGLGLLKDWNAVTDQQIDNSTTVPTESAAKCQAQCAAVAECKFFTYNGQSLMGGKYGYFGGLCFLQKELSCQGEKYGHHHGAISGPRACDNPAVDSADRTSALSVPLVLLLGVAARAAVI